MIRSFRIHRLLEFDGAWVVDAPGNATSIRGLAGGKFIAQFIDYDVSVGVLPSESLAAEKKVAGSNGPYGARPRPRPVSPVASRAENVVRQDQQSHRAANHDRTQRVEGGSAKPSVVSSAQ
jgi:hypothetical protein